MTSFTVNSLQSKSDFKIELDEQFKEKKYLIVSIKSATRLQIQNRWIQQFYTMISRQSGQPRQDLVNHCKYYHGLPILLIDSPVEAVIWRKMMSTLTEEERLKSMEKTAVTSLFNVNECSDYIKQLINHFNNYELPEKQWREK